MKTRNEIYQGEGAKLLRFITTYHTLRYDQVLQLFSRHEQSIKSLITSLIKQEKESRKNEVEYEYKIYAYLGYEDLEIEAEIVGYDTKVDMAVIKIIDIITISIITNISKFATYNS